MSLVEEIQEILDKKYPKLCARARTRIDTDGVWIFLNFGTVKWLNCVDEIDNTVKVSLEEAKQLLESSLEEINR